MEKVLIHHAEIGLKKGNFPYFEKKLVKNIKKSIMVEKIRREEKRIIAEIDSTKDKIIKSLKNVFGIKYFAFIDEIERDLKGIEKHCEKILKEFKGQGCEKIAFQTKRGDKQFKLTSLELNKRLGDIASKIGLKVNYGDPDKTLFTEITSKKIYMHKERINGPGGLPVSTSGKVLCLLSGGIDSIVAAWLMMKRGCNVDFLHFHTYRNNKDVVKTKIKKLVDVLDKYQYKSKLYLIPYAHYELWTQGKVFQRYDLVLFKHYMLKIAEQFAIKNRYCGIVTGDNLAQVASQTIENLKATSTDIKIPIFRPLLTYDKQEIIDLAKKIGTYDLSVQKYKDCCSILSKKPSTKTKLEVFEKIVKKAELKNLIAKTIEEIKEVKT